MKPVIDRKDPIKVSLFRLLLYIGLLVTDLLAFLYILLKIYKILVFTKIILNQLPLFNPYIWPISLIKKLTKPYFKFCRHTIPRIYVGKRKFDVSMVLGLEFLSVARSLILALRTWLLELILKGVATLPPC